MVQGIKELTFAYPTLDNDQLCMLHAINMDNENEANIVYHYSNHGVYEMYAPIIQALLKKLEEI